MTDAQMTGIGAFVAVLGFLLAAAAAHAPGTEDIPALGWLLLGATNAGLAFYLGKTHPGTK